MKFSEMINHSEKFTPIPLPSTEAIQKAAKRIEDRWPEVEVLSSEEKKDLALLLKDKVEAWRRQTLWDETRVSFMKRAALAVFDTTLHNELDLSDAQHFIYEQTALSKSESFLSEMLAIYFDSFVADSERSKKFAQSIKWSFEKNKFRDTDQLLLSNVPELLDPVLGPARLAVRVKKMAHPFGTLVQAGVNDPHGFGFMHEMHAEFSKLIARELTTLDKIKWFVEWIKPSKPREQAIRVKMAIPAIEALVSPWLHQNPSNEIKQYLVDTLLDLYEDPRYRTNIVWKGVGKPFLDKIKEWFNKIDLLFFTGVIDAAQSSHMWINRRKFWHNLFDEGNIDNTWAAFSKEAKRIAPEHFEPEEQESDRLRYGEQTARQNTSLLIMEIHDKIVVEGCHSYKTRIYSKDHPQVPELFKETYNCEKYVRTAPIAIPHNSIFNWEKQVRDAIYNTDTFIMRFRHLTTFFGRR